VAGLTIDGVGQSITVSGDSSVRVMIVSPAGKLDLRNLTIANGSVPAGSGGGILNTGGTLTLTNSTVSSNATRLEGGGITNRGTTTLLNSTVSGNSAADGFGGGIYNNFTGKLTLLNSTVSRNSAADGSGGGISNAGVAQLQNTIVANSLSGGNCSGVAITSLGHNLSSDGSCAFAEAGDLNNTDPMLGPLANNGGPTQTHALLPGSPAIDAGSSDCPPPATDQRGVSRPQDGDGGAGAVCDVGAFELEARGAHGPTTPTLPSPSPSPSPSSTATSTPSGAPAPSPGSTVVQSPTPTPSPQSSATPARASFLTPTPACSVDDDGNHQDSDDSRVRSLLDPDDDNVDTRPRRDPEHNDDQRRHCEDEQGDDDHGPEE